MQRVTIGDAALTSARTVVQDSEVELVVSATAVPTPLSHVPLDYHSSSTFLQSSHRPHEALAAILVSPFPVWTTDYSLTQSCLHHYLIRTVLFSQEWGNPQNIPAHSPTHYSRSCARAQIYVFFSTP